MIYEKRQLLRIFEQLKPVTEDCTPSPDMSSIEAIRAGWRWQTPCPDDATIEATWNSIKADVELQDVQQRRREEYVKQGVTTDAMVVALWEKLVESRNDSANALQLKRQDVKQRISKQS